MNVSERLGPKSDKLSVLPPSTLYLLAAPSMPDEAIAKVEEQLINGRRISVDLVQRIIYSAKQSTQAQPTGPAEIDGEVISSVRVNPGAELRQATAQRLERTLATVVELLAGSADADWVALFQTDAVKRLRTRRADSNNRSYSNTKTKSPQCKAFTKPTICRIYSTGLVTALHRQSDNQSYFIPRS